MNQFIVFGQFADVHLKEMGNGLKLFNQKKYWECHEDLEHYWLERRGDNARYVYWAIIQVAASLYHFEAENKVGAWSLLHKANEKFKFCEDKNVETAILTQSIPWNELKQLVRDLLASNNWDNFIKLTEFKFNRTNE